MKPRLAVLLLFAVLPGAVAQPPPPLLPPTPPPPPLAPSCVLTADYLRWYTRGLTPPPLLTTSSVQDAGVIGRPTTGILFGGDTGTTQPFQGGRFVGRFLCDETWGLLGTADYLTNGGQYYVFTPGFLAVPYFDPNTRGNASVILQNPGLQAGYANVEVYSRLWGATASGFYTVSRDPNTPLEARLGVKYQQLFENLTLNTSTNFTNASTFVGQAAPAGTTYVGTDQFGTRNHFYGLTGGLAGNWRCGNWLVEADVALGLGMTHQEVNSRGQTDFNVPPTASTFGNVFTQITNQGRAKRDVFTFLPQANVRCGYQVFDVVRVFAGFDFLYWSSVVRPDRQINPLVNTTLIPTLTTGNQVGARQPAGLFVGRDFWATGFSLGLDLAF